MEEILTPKMGAACEKDTSDSAAGSAQTKAVGLVPGGNCWGMGERVPTPRENPSGPGTGEQQALIGREEKQTDHLLKKRGEGCMRWRHGKVKGPPSPFPSPAVPTPQMAHSWALPGGNPFTGLSHSPPGSPLSPPPDPCCLASEEWSLRLDLGGQRKKTGKGGGWGLVRGPGPQGLGQALWG